MITDRIKRDKVTITVDNYVKRYYNHEVSCNYSFIIKQVGRYMRKISILTFIIVFITVLTGCGVKDAESVAKEKVSVYDTTQYEGYRRLYNFVVTSMPDGIITEVSETELTYENGDIFLEVTTTDDWKCLFQVYTEGEFCYEFECNGRDVGAIAQVGLYSAYVDITMDGVKDVVIVVPPVRGTMTGPSLAYAYDVKEGKAIDLFQEDGSLTDEQLETVKEFLDGEFYEIFPEFNDISYMKQFGELYVDEFGQMYYSSVISGKELQDTIGQILIFLNWDKEESGFFISDIMYMPDCIENID